ncbi:MAG: hypothetical protein Q7R50_01085 [Dehalococcoidales bacterium]|nr:hypothetical protein [Dehalococcoidales bacterium]
MDTVRDVNEKVMRLWEEWHCKLKDGNLKVPLIYPDLNNTDALLFIGMNPSFVLTAYEKNLKDTNYQSTDVKRFFSWGNHYFDMAECGKIEKIMRTKYKKYFGKFEKIAEEALGNPLKYEHIDLFFNRETSQREFERKILNNPVMKEFVLCQLELSKSLIKHVHPKLIVVANAGAAKLFEKKAETGNLGEEFHLQWSEEQGYHTAVINEKPIPVFLTSMLTGQRALDDGSYRRLKWHIKKALKDVSSV